MARPADSRIRPRVTEELADDLASDAIVRDRSGEPPYDEVARLREAGLLGVLTPPGPGRQGSGWRTACAIVREIAAADGSIGELLARHYALSWGPRFFGCSGPDSAVELRAGHEQWLWSGSIDGAEAAAASGLSVTPVGDGYVLDGWTPVEAGVGVADMLLLGALCTRSGDVLMVLVDPRHPGVVADSAQDRLGQRRTGAGSVRFDSVRVAGDRVLGAVPRDEHAVSPFTALAPLALRLVLAHVALGIAEGALAEARDISRALPGTWRAADTGHSGEYAGPPGADPYVLLAYGELVTSAHTAASVVERATEALARGVRTGPELGVDDRADIAVLVTAAESVATDAVLRITARVLELTAGASASGRAAGGTPADGAAGCDRFWRNARVLTTRSASAYGLRDIGDYYLNGSHPPLT